MIRKNLLLTLLMALFVPLAAWAQSAYQFGPGQNHYYSTGFSGSDYWGFTSPSAVNGCDERWWGPGTTTINGAQVSCLYVQNYGSDALGYSEGVIAQFGENYPSRVVYAYKKFYLPEGTYELDFDYVVGGHGFGIGAQHAALYVYMVRDNSDLPSNYDFINYFFPPTGWTLIAGPLYDLTNWSEWKHRKRDVFINESGNYKLVFAWCNHTYYQTSMTLTGKACAIDNVVLRAVSYNDAPQGLTATNITTNSAQLQWNAMTGSPFCYRLEYRNWDSSPSDYSSVELTTTRWNLSNLVAGRHEARVMAKYRYTIGNNIYYAETDYSPYCFFTIDPPTLPKPNGLTQTSISDHSISFYWTTYGQYVPMGYNLVNQEIKYTNTTTNSSQTIVHTNISDYSQLIDNLDPATTYSIQVRGKYTRDGAASTSFWYSDWSNPLVATTLALTLPQPYNLSLYSISDNHLSFNWKVDNGTVPADYSLVCQQIRYTNTATNDSQTIEYTDTFANAERIDGLSPYTTYSVKVRGKYTRTGAASNSFWYSEWSDPLVATTLLPKPTNVSVTDQGTSWAKIAWELNTNNIQLPEGKQIAYAYQLGNVVPSPTIPGQTTIDWGEQVSGLANTNVTLPMIPVGNCMIRLWAHLADHSSSTVAYSDYGGMQLFEFTITGPQNAITSADFPYTVDFDDYSIYDNQYYFHDSLTVSGATQTLSIYARDYVTGNYCLEYYGYETSGNEETCVMLPKVIPGTGSDTWLKFELRHDQWENALTNVVVDYSTDGTAWQQIGPPIYVRAASSGWKDYSRILPKTDEEIWVRLRFTGTGEIRIDNLSINTDCGDYIITVSEPYTEGFEDVVHSACWQGEGWVLNQSSGYSGRCAYNDDQDSELLSPGFIFSGCGMASISFYAKGSAGAALKVYYGTDYANSEIIPLDGISSSWQKFEISLSQYITDMVKVAFVPDANNPILRVDEITVSGMSLPNITVWVNDGGWGSTVYAEFEWYHSNITLAEGQSILYDCSMGAISGEEVTWHDMGSVTNQYSYSYLPVGNHKFRVRMRIVEGNTTIATGEWYEIYEPFPIVAANPVNNYPFTFNFEGGGYDPLDGLNLSGTIENVNRFEIGKETTTGIAPHGDGSKYLYFHRNGNNSDDASVVLPMFYNSSQTELAVSFWLYTNTAPLQGVRLEYSPDGENWSTEDYVYCNICDNAWNRFVYKINLVGEGTITPHVYVRLRFICSETYTEQILCLDDISVQPLSNYKPYITDATSTANSVTLSVIDKAYENGSGSQRFEVDYRVVGTDSWTPKAFDNEEPYEQVVQLTVDGLEPNTYYEFRAFSVMPNAAINTTIWSESSNIYSQWTDNALFIVSPGHPYEFGFETAGDNWTAGEWNVEYTTTPHSGEQCAYMSNAAVSELVSPEIHFDESCENIVVRFWCKGSGRVYVYHGEDFAQSSYTTQLNNQANWVKRDFSLSRFIDGLPVKAVKIAFRNDYTSGTPKDMYIDDFEVVANAYDKVFDPAPGQQTASWDYAGNWWPHSVPTSSESVFVYRNAVVGSSNGANPYTASAGTIHFGLSANYSQVQVYSGSVLEAAQINYRASNNVNIYDGGQLKVGSTCYAQVFKRFIGYDNANSTDHWYLFANPTRGTGNPPSGLITGEYDLYSFDGTADLEWLNYKNHNFNMSNGKGYLYAHAKPTTGSNDYTEVGFAGMVNAANADQTVTGLTYGENTEANPFYNWNLVGNPYPCNAYLSGNRAFYRLEETAEGSRIVLAEDNVIKPMEGVFVQAATSAESSVTFTTTAPNSGRGAIDFTLSKHSSTRNGANVVADRTRISFSEGKGMGHLDLMADANRLYIPQGGKDMAVVCSEPAGEMPLNFEAAENGTYTLGISLNDTELVYCHLIDNLTGADVDLIPLCKGGQGDSTPATYTFEAKTTDYRSRFKVVFVAKSAFEGDNANNFAFHNGSAWVVNASADATVQVIDMTGRVVVSTDVARGVSTNGIAPGVYVMRLIDGNDVKTQKIVVD